MAELVAIRSSYHPVTVAFNAPGIGRLPGVDSAGNFDYIHRIDARDDVIHKVGLGVGREEEIYVAAGEKMLRESREHMPVAALSPLDLPEEFYGFYAQHKMDNVLQSIQKDSKIAREIF